MLKKLVSILVVTFLSACSVQQQHLSTPTGSPEIIIESVSKKQVVDKMVELLLAKGNKIKSVNDYGVVTGKLIDNSLLASVLYGSKYDTTPELRQTYNAVDVAQGVRVFAHAEIVTNPGSSFEHVTDVTNNYGKQIQESLEHLRDKFSASGNAPNSLNSNKGTE